jgi:hypothetical protein
MKRNDLRFRVHHEGQDPNSPPEPEEEEYEDVSDLDQEEIMRLNHQLEAGSQATQTADIEDEELDKYEAND